MGEVIGRDRELREGEAFLDAAAAGPARLLLEGDAGIGKTTIWSAIAARAEARGAVVLRSQPTAAETPLTLAALGDLLEQVPQAALATLPAPQRRAIDAALMRADGPGDGLDQRRLGAATRSALQAMAAEAPVVVAVDDVQWLDESSAVTLGFALRRLARAPVGILAARRTGPLGPLDLDSLPADVARFEVPVGVLTLGALHHVLKERFGGPWPRSTLVRIHHASDGHPLFAIEIARLLHGRPAPPADEPLPVPPTIRELVRGRVRALPAATRSVLLAVAAQAAPTVAGLSAALGRDIGPDLAIAERQEVARVASGRIGFAHPLFAAAIYGEATDEERREAHGRLAAAAENIEERARHRALASDGPDPEIAGELAAAAHVAATRGAPLAAAELLRLSIRRTPPGEVDAIDERTIELGRRRKLGGDTTAAQAVLEEAVRGASSRPAPARAGRQLATVQYDLDAGPRSYALARQALDDAAGDPELLVHAHAMLAAVDYDDRRRAIDHALEARRLLADVRDPGVEVESLVCYVYAGSEVQAGRPIPMDIVARALELERIAPPPVVSDRLSASLGWWLFLVDDDIDGARRWMEATARAAVEEGDDGSVPYSLSHLPLLEFAAGNWPRAEEVARQHLAVATQQEMDSERLDALFGLSNVLVHRGREAEARTLIDELLRGADAAGSLWDTTKGQTALGALELSLGNVEAAAEQLSRAEDGRNRIGDDMNRRHEGDLVEALVATGRTAEAREVAAAVDRRARHYRRRSRLAVAARSRALVGAADGRLDDAMAALAEALDLHRQATFPFDLARTQLVVGRVRRRRRERTLAKAAFDEALAGFEALGADRWAAQARAELARVGLRRSSGETLTEGERRVAELAAAGMTNRDVAATLFLSPKTVEVTLSRVYAKLGIRSRAELGARIATDRLQT
jgi:DNA-binding CsgD family transcriptional regulator